MKFIPIKDDSKEDNTSCSAYYATSFKNFLSLLSVTKVNSDGAYNITEYISYVSERPVPFDKLLQKFAEIVYTRTVPDEAKLSKFYKKAYAIKEEAQKGRNILNTPPKEMIK